MNLPLYYLATGLFLLDLKLQKPEMFIKYILHENSTWLKHTTERMSQNPKFSWLPKRLCVVKILKRSTFGTQRNRLTLAGTNLQPVLEKYWLSFGV